MANFTEQAIKKTFMELLAEYPISQITVKEIVARCGINRNSFYYHFQDIPALVESIVTEVADSIMEQYSTIDTMEMGFRAALDFVRQNQKALLHIYYSANRDIFEHYLWKVCEYVVTAYAERVPLSTELSAFDRETIRKMYMCQCFGIAIYWLEFGRKEDPELTVKRISEIQKAILEDMERRAHTEKTSENQ